MKTSKKSKPAAKPAPKKSSFWDDDDDAPAPVKAEPVVVKEIPAEAKPAKRVPPPPPPRKIVEAPKQLAELTTPPDFHNIRCGEDRVVIMAVLDSLAKDLLCFHVRLGCTIHLKREDLGPSDIVERAVAFVLEARK